MSATRKQIIKEAREWLGTRWTHQGFSKRWGCDCVGFIRGVGDLCGALHPGECKDLVDLYTGYSREPNPRIMRTALKVFLIHIPREEAVPGDILWFRIGKFPRHLGIITEPNIVIHADTISKKVIEHGIVKSRVSSIVAAFKFPDVLEV